MPLKPSHVVGKLGVGRSASPAQKAENLFSSKPFVISVLLMASETVEMQVAGLTYFLPLIHPDNPPLPPTMPLLAYPHHNLISRGVLAFPFLTNPDDLSSIALMCNVNAPLVVKEGDIVATATQ